MQNPFWNSPGPRFADRDEAINLARKTARKIAERHPEVLRILLFGSFAREDYGIRSDLDLLIILRESDEAAPERIQRFLEYAPVYPTDMLVYTDEELRTRVSAGDAFIARILRESIQLWPDENN
jgi:predicted nucleotidyltransferase